MIYKVHIGNAMIWADKITVLPNKWGGINNVRLRTIESLWTGQSHLWLRHHASVTLQLSDIDLIQSRSTLDETDEPWETVVASKPTPIGKFYEYWRGIAKTLRKLK